MSMFGANNRRNLSKDRVDVESLERENDRGLDTLSDRVGLLKAATMGIMTEVDSQHRVLDDIDGGMSGTRGLLGSVTDKFQTVRGVPPRAHAVHACTLHPPMALITACMHGVCCRSWLTSRTIRSSLASQSQPCCCCSRGTCPHGDGQ